MNKKIIFQIVVVVVAIVFFLLGSLISGSKNTSNNLPPAGFGQNMKNGQRSGSVVMRGGVNGGGLMGDVISKDGKNITVKLADGGSKLVSLSDATEITKSEKGVIDDIKEGTKIFVTGEQSTEGIYAAKTIQIRDNLVIPSPNN